MTDIILPRLTREALRVKSRRERRRDIRERFMIVEFKVNDDERQEFDENGAYDEFELYAQAQKHDEMKE
jgi:hypothetical protein